MNTRTDLAWAAGFFDAEGCFSRAGPTPMASLGQVDLEPLDVFVNTVQIGSLNGPYDRATQEINRRPQWVHQVYGKNARALFAMLEPWLGNYRRDQGVRVALGDGETDPSRPFSTWSWAEQVAWCAGFFEGDGTFSRSSAGLTARATSTDLELIERCQVTLGTGHVYGPYNKGPRRKQQWVFTTSGFEEMQAILAMLWPWLSSRRRLTALNLLGHYLTFYACGHEREDAPWHKHCPQCFKPGPKPGSKRRKSSM